MWEYRVVSGHYNVDGANVFLKNPAGEGTLQLVLDHYGGERWELVSSSFDNVHRELVLVFKRPRAGAAAAPPAVPAAVFVDPELGAQERAVVLELAAGRRRVSLGQIGAHQGTVGALAQGIELDRGDRRLDRLWMAPGSDQLLDEDLQGMQTQVRQAFPRL